MSWPTAAAVGPVALTCGSLRPALSFRSHLKGGRYVDVASIVYSEPRAAFYRYLQGIVEAGYGDRVMFGSDQMIWPGVIEPAIQSIEEAPFLSAEQKRDILYNNAARFLRLSAEVIARHHRQ